MNAVELIKTRVGNLTVPYGETIEGNAAWKNHVIEPGTMIQVGFLLGKDGGPYVFEQEGEEWLLASVIERLAPDMPSETSDTIPSRAAWRLNGAWDGLGFVGQATGPITTLLWNDRIIGLHADQFMANMLLLGSKWFGNVLKVEEPALTALAIPRFFVATYSRIGAGHFIVRCAVRNPEDFVAQAWLRFTGMLYRAGGWDPDPVDETFDLIIGPGETLEVALPQWNSCLDDDDAWIQLETSWGQVIGPIYFKAGHHHDHGSFHVQQITSNSAVIVGGWPNSYTECSFYLKTPYAGPAEHEIYETCIFHPLDFALGCYFYAHPLLSGREYYAGLFTPHYSPGLIFWTK